MTGLMAGLLAWAIELGVAAIMFMTLRHEEKKVLKRRKKK
mgnify:FL=1|jgi:hypothetical protein|tara:strand:+ start:665 stop:784 length:120 start_codon:yes stop_codon:yes gene_type:complete